MAHNEIKRKDSNFPTVHTGIFKAIYINWLNALATNPAVSNYGNVHAKRTNETSKCTQLFVSSYELNISAYA